MTAREYACLVAKLLNLISARGDLHRVENRALLNQCYVVRDATREILDATTTHPGRTRSTTEPISE